jgi:hypothetical protein
VQSDILLSFQLNACDSDVDVPPGREAVADFSAREAGLGYFYQARYGLWLLLDSDEENELVLESLDDLVLETAGSALELLQTKHHVRHQATLTNTSAELWKTLRIWSTHLLSRRIAVPSTRLTLITTATAAEDSIASLLRPDTKRDSRAATQRLIQVATSSTNAELKGAFDAFMALTPDAQLALLEATYVLDKSPSILDIGDRIRNRIRAAAARQHREAVFERLEGWWFARVVEQLRSASPDPISGFEVYDKLSAISEQFRPDALPIDFLDARPDSVDAQADNRMFVHQLRTIDLSQTRIEKAIVDYYRAFEQRSRWAREDLLVGGEVEAYERRLIDEWERFAAAVTQEVPSDAQEEYLRRVGRDIFGWMEFKTDVRIRANVTEPYVMRGSYHMLANKPVPSVWWHPQFARSVAAIVGAGEKR